jgi:hypothetical protein
MNQAFHVTLEKPLSYVVHPLFRQTAVQQHQLWCLDFKDGFPFGFAAT